MLSWSVLGVFRLEYLNQQGGVQGWPRALVVLQGLAGRKETGC